ncbi:restriction endonuclease subunit R [Fructilactobacillus sanfranciscensis]|nr:restriction endonuclease subunit R [Fructilactobacillus sanfranciscensis]
MVSKYTSSELDFEADLVDKLTHNGWTHVKKLDDATPQQLEDHFREILNQNNR